jgi:hypothetical protein
MRIVIPDKDEVVSSNPLAPTGFLGIHSETLTNYGLIKHDGKYKKSKISFTITYYLFFKWHESEMKGR